MMPSIAQLPIDWMLTQSECNPRTSFQQTTAATVTYQGERQIPTDCFTVSIESDSMVKDSFDWMSLSSEVLPNARPLTAEERSSINEFFWSQFK